MSGGHYNYACHQVRNLAEDIHQDIVKYSVAGLCEDSRRGAISPGALAIMQEAAAGLAAFGQLAHDVEWYMSGDYGDATLQRAYNSWRTGLGAQHIMGAPDPRLKEHSTMLGQIAAIVGDYLPDPSELSTLDGVRAMQAELERLRAEVAWCRAGRPVES